MKISVITITFNNEKGLSRTLESLRSQKIENLQVIVIDGGSSDGSLEMIRKSPVVTDWISESDNGVYNAMNKGLQRVTGDLVFFLNGGDEFTGSGVLQQVTGFISRHPGFDIYYGNVLDIYEDGRQALRKPDSISKVSLYRKMICHQGIFAAARLFKENGGFDEELRIKADYDWLLRNIFRNASHCYMDLQIANYEMGGISTTLYDTVSVREIPRVRDRYYSARIQKKIRRYLLNPRIPVFYWLYNRPVFTRMIDKCIK
ncbi:glycosyltransferase family 2 protein [Flavihumibacter petaseus]|uniref:Putative glycosyltransferase n=1 Tax=Flavihumibacter petaseus NBRC 106054 TaxID=1220578 RepID=A0A0E9N5X6_9BACT|nr:glycosyltransferase family 2 protein [Flavihumibacter petaseus]GAO45224.1 putative glycosyltransferase [Flavihumibacter petaseus NBRC 106054]